MTRASVASAALLSCLVAAVPAAAQVTRVSVSTAGAEANGGSVHPSISRDGRFVVFSSLASNLVADDTNGVEDVFLRDRDTDADGVFDEPGAVATTRLSVGSGGVELTGASSEPVITPDGRFVAFTSTAPNLIAGNSGVAQVYRLDRTTSTLIRISERVDGAAGNAASASPVISDDGDVVAFASDAQNLSDAVPPVEQYLTTNYVRKVSDDTTTRLFIDDGRFPPFATLTNYFQRPPTITGDGRLVTFTEIVVFLGHAAAPGAYIVDLSANNTAIPIKGGGQKMLSADGSALAIGGQGAALEDTMVRRVVATGAETTPVRLPNIFPNTWATPAAVSRTGRLATTDTGHLFDLALGLVTPPGYFLSTPVNNHSLNAVPPSAAFSGDERWLAIASYDGTILPGNADTNGTDDIFVIDLPDYLDADDDSMDDRWEALFGVTDPAGDPDGDGQTNAQEEDAGTHPNGQVQRFLAEGATGSFFHTTIALANPSPTLAATAVLTFDRGDGTRVRRPVAVPAGRSTLVDVGAVVGVETADVSTTVESDRFLAVERSMTWGATPSTIYGSHAESAAASPSTTWFLAEGSTVLDFDLFYLLQNPQPATTHATVRYLLPSGTTITRTYDLAPGSRTTIHVNQIAGLEETDVSGEITADAPIVVERAMYRTLPGQPFGLGTESMGVPAAATSWFLAEGATGTFFDLFVLVANPGAADATVEALYAKPDGTTVTQTYTVRAHSRHSVYVDSIPGLDNTSVATTLTSTNGAPIVAERAMYWPGGFFDYYEGHTSAGSTSTALEWVVAGGEDAGPHAAQTFVLIANTENRAGEATVTVLLPILYSYVVPAPIVVPLPANSRTTVPMTNVLTPFGVRVQSTGPSPVQLVVESAVYRSDGGVTWSSGSNALATPVP